MTNIVNSPNPVLSSKAKSVKKIDTNIKKVIANMIDALNSATDPIGVGLAAPQIGESLRIFITKPTPNSKIRIFINPEIINISLEKKVDPKIRSKKTKKGPIKLEGCLSLPNIWGEVKRNSSITITFLDEKGNRKEETFTGFMATIIQHEIDHLEGVLFPKRVLEQKRTLFKSSKNEKNEDIFEEISI